MDIGRTGDMKINAVNIVKFVRSSVMSSINYVTLGISEIRREQRDGISEIRERRTGEFTSRTKRNTCTNKKRASVTTTGSGGNKFDAGMQENSEITVDSVWCGHEYVADPEEWRRENEIGERSETGSGKRKCHSD